MNLARRMTKLEGEAPSELSPRVKAWLGWQLSPAEQAELDRGDDLDADDIDTSALSGEARAWLGLD